jgi:hypothetical protein
VENKMLSNGLRTLVVAAQILADTDRSEFAAGLLAYVQQHHASTVLARDKARWLLDELAAELPPEGLKGAETAFEQLTVGALLEQVLADL